jgi:hypothetical protein
MKLALLGTDADSLALAEAAVLDGHAIVWLGDPRPEDLPQIQPLVPGLGVSDDWESLLDHGLIDAVIVGRGAAADAVRADQLKRLAADIMPLLVVHPVGNSVLVYYELDMARQEVHGIMRHYTPGVGSPAIVELGDWVQNGSGPIGIVHQVICQRDLADCSRETVTQHLARDVEILSAVTGGVRTVNAMGPKASDATYASLQIQMTGPGAATLRWAVTPVSDTSSYPALSLIGEHGTATLTLTADESILVTNIGGALESIKTPVFDGPRTAIAELAAAIPANGTEQSEEASTWSAAIASMEIVDAIELSLQKGRTIEVYRQRLTEQLAFRGTMAALGCGLLVLGFLVLVIVSFVGGLESVLEKPIVSSWPVVLLTVLTFFLLLQMLPWLVTKRRSGPAGKEHSGDDGDNS